MNLSLRCPQCKVPLAILEFAWRHRHPHPRLRLIGAVMMVVGALESAIGLGMIVSG